MLVALAWSSLAFCDEITDAANIGDFDKVKALLQDNPKLNFSRNSDSRTPLHLAAAGGHKDMVALLLDNKADVNARDGRSGIGRAQGHG